MDYLIESLLDGNKDGSFENYKEIEKFQNGFIETITDNATRNKYRNPPAHTRDLSYYTACECRKLVRETLIKMRDMF